MTAMDVFDNAIPVGAKLTVMMSTGRVMDGIFHGIDKELALITLGVWKIDANHVIGWKPGSASAGSLHAGRSDWSSRRSLGSDA